MAHMLLRHECSVLVSSLQGLLRTEFSLLRCPHSRVSSEQSPVYSFQGVLGSTLIIMCGIYRLCRESYYVHSTGNDRHSKVGSGRYGAFLSKAPGQR